jgi:hypothetical protein
MRWSAPVIRKLINRAACAFHLGMIRSCLHSKVFNYVEFASIFRFSIALRPPNGALWIPSRKVSLFRNISSKEEEKFKTSVCSSRSTSHRSRPSPPPSAAFRYDIMPISDLNFCYQFLSIRLRVIEILLIRKLKNVSV